MLRKICYSLGGLFLVAGAILPLISPDAAPYVFALGALLFSPMQMSDRYEGRNIVIRRLRRQQVMGAFMLLLTAALRFMSLWQISPFRGREWLITLMIAALLELYAIYRIAHEEEKEHRN